MKRYIIVRARCLQDLERYVKEAISKGYWPTGGVAKTCVPACYGEDSEYMQAMVR